MKSLKKVLKKESSYAIGHAYIMGAIHPDSDMLENASYKKDATSLGNLIQKHHPDWNHSTAIKEGIKSGEANRKLDWSGINRSAGYDLISLKTGHHESVIKSSANIIEKHY